ncbi:helix-turn-helix domain-containing protein [Streptomyces cocklensis]|uniref:XRE family transcriptional regulator n=1 Tax=Actinacidiphila cocklensis TaxID=887465 RepID=A0A9W4DNP5_9ACTN|nr:helix-turn-helix transcriptional regulator [Actinacidiphila cocklensis]MDD1063005.1 helix-turn-helix domain-containing protein [Actinacidiphila cocklensis]CAG6394792.1 XRE family transcriptional regulator [Actinacidiphila cocklensis]
MVQPKELNPFDSPQSFYGAELRRLREKAGFSQEGLGERVFCSGAYVGQIESASRRPQLDLSQRMDTVLDTGGHLERLCRMVLKATKHAEYFADVVDLMTHALTIRQVSNSLIPGLFQIEPYARALFESADPSRPAEKVEEMVAARLSRAWLLGNPTKPKFWIILNENVLRAPVCDRQGMYEQLMHLARIVRARRVTFQVMPASVGAHPLMGSDITLMTFADAPPAAYVEAARSGHLLDTPAMVESYAEAYDFARAVALSPEASLDLIESVAEEYSAQ